MDEAEITASDAQPQALADVLAAIKADRLLVEFLTTAFGDRAIATTAVTSDSLELGAPESRTAVFVHPTHIEIDLDPAVGAQLTEWHGELRLVDSPWSSLDQLLRVKATDLFNPTLRTSLLNAMPGIYERSESRPPRPAATAKPVRKPRQPRATSPRTPRQPAPAKPATKDSPMQSWEEICPNCMMVHRAGIECY